MCTTDFTHFFVRVMMTSIMYKTYYQGDGCVQF